MLEQGFIKGVLKMNIIKTGAEVKCKEPILPDDVTKVLFDGSSQYKIYFLQKKDKTGTTRNYYFLNSKGQKTCYYYEEFVNGNWIYREEIPNNAFCEVVAEVKPI